MSPAQTPLTAVGLANRWLYERLAGDAQLLALVPGGVHEGIAPQATTYPLITFQCITGTDTTAPGFRRVLTTQTYDVHIADRSGSLAVLDQIAGRVDALLHGQQGYQFDSGAYTVACQRTAARPLSGVVTGVQTRELVVSYSILVQEAGDV